MNAQLSSLHIVGWCALLGALLAGMFYLAFMPVATCPDRPAADCYFQTSAGNREATGFDHFHSDWYARHLAAMREPSLAEQRDVRAWRFLWLRTFHHPVAVRIVESDGRLQLTAVELDGAGGYSPGNELRRIETVLGEEQTRNILRMLAEKDIWSIPPVEDRMGLDGSQWVFELRDGDKYHVVDRWSPEEGPIRELGIAFLDLTSWDFPRRDLY